MPKTRSQSRQKVDGRKKQGSKSEAVEAEAEAHDSSSESEDRLSEGDIKQALRRLGLKPGQEYEFTDGDVVWAKYGPYPWWPGQVWFSSDANHGAEAHNDDSDDTILVRWFGDYGDRQDPCVGQLVVPFDISLKKKIAKEVKRADVTSYNESCSAARKVQEEIDEEMGRPRDSVPDSAAASAAAAAAASPPADEDDDASVESGDDSKIDSHDATADAVPSSHRPSQQRRRSKRINQRQNGTDKSSSAAAVDALEETDANEEKTSPNSTRGGRKRRRSSSQQSQSQKQSQSQQSQSQSDTDTAQSPSQPRRRSVRIARREAADHPTSASTTAAAEHDSSASAAATVPSKKRSKRGSKRGRMARNMLTEAEEKRNVALESITKSHSAEDLTIFVALTYYQCIMEEYSQNDALGFVGSAYNITGNDILDHLQWFDEENVTPASKRRR